MEVDRCSCGGQELLQTWGFSQHPQWVETLVWTRFRVLYNTCNVCQDVQIRVYVFCRYICSETKRRDVMISTPVSYLEGPDFYS